MLSGFPSTNGFETDLGARVRTLRRERGLTLKGLGRLAGLSHPFLSQVERGLARPSVSSVERIAAALDVSVAHLWSPPRQGDAVRVVRSGEGAFAEHNGTTYRELPGEPAAPTLREWTASNRRWPTRIKSRCSRPCGSSSRATSAATPGSTSPAASLFRADPDTAAARPASTAARRDVIVFSCPPSRSAK